MLYTHHHADTYYRGSLHMITIAIIGAGLSGLTAANTLKDHANITVFEKSHGVSGRMSTRREAAYFFDHGAQFFKVRTNEFKQFINPMIECGIIKRWDARLVEFEDRKVMQSSVWNEHSPYYVGAPAMNAIAKYLSQGLNVQLDTRVRSFKKNPIEKNVIKKSHGKWHLEDDQGNKLGEYDWVISTVPAEQAVALLPSSLPFSESISAIKMNGCFALMLGFEKALPLDFDAALVHGEDIRWIAVNSSKPGRDDVFCLVVHSTDAWADEHIDGCRNEIMNYLCNLTSDIIGYDLNGADHKAIHGWRFANSGKQTGETHFIHALQHIAVCGDWFIQGSVEAAFTSGFDVANSILKSIKIGELKG
jgi:renalase